MLIRTNGSYSEMPTTREGQDKQQASQRRENFVLRLSTKRLEQELQLAETNVDGARSEAAHLQSELNAAGKKCAEAESRSGEAEARLKHLVDAGKADAVELARRKADVKRLEDEAEENSAKFEMTGKNLGVRRVKSVNPRDRSVMYT